MESRAKQISSATDKIIPDNCLLGSAFYVGVDNQGDLVVPGGNGGKIIKGPGEKCPVQRRKILQVAGALLFCTDFECSGNSTLSKSSPS